MTTATRTIPLPSWFVYCDNTTAVNALCFSIADLDVYYSYQTVVAFRSPKHGLVVRKNEWGPTTGKHLNAIDGGEKKKRVNAEEFQRLFLEARKDEE